MDTLGPTIRGAFLAVMTVLGIFVAGAVVGLAALLLQGVSFIVRNWPQ